MQIQIIKKSANLRKDDEVYEIETDAIEHAICMGIRHGLYGAHADSDVNIDYPLEHQALALEEIASAINNLADAIRETKLP